MMYGRFLAEAAGLTGEDGFDEAGRRMQAIGRAGDAAAALFAQRRAPRIRQWPWLKCAPFCPTSQRKRLFGADCLRQRTNDVWAVRRRSSEHVAMVDLRDRLRPHRLGLARGALRSRDAHGFYRFFAFEAILGLVALNTAAWFSDPFSLRQLASWVLLLTSLLLAAHGFYLLRRVGKPDRSIEDAHAWGLRKRPTGAQRRVPLHPPSALPRPPGAGLGMFLKGPSWPTALLAAMATGALYLTTAASRERE